MQFLPYGVIKRQWDFYYIMTKKNIKRAKADARMIFTAYNLRRIFNILDKNVLKAYLKGLNLYFMQHILQFKAILAAFCILLVQKNYKKRSFPNAQNQFISLNSALSLC